jgi:nicotinamide-nucleotide amidase
VTSTAAEVLRLLTVRGETLAVAESLTGGLVAAELAAVPGASKAFRGSVTAYATDLKRDVLGVDAALLDQRGAVDPQVAESRGPSPRTGSRSARFSSPSTGPGRRRTNVLLAGKWRRCG